jgi:multiple sugar transport system ATP-binding protein
MNAGVKGLGAGTMNDVALSLVGVDKIYAPTAKKPVHAVKALDLDVRKGEIIALLGSSGCGKTSTLRMIAGFESVTNGSITLSGRRIEHLAPARRGVAMAFEGYSLYPPLTVRDNIAFALKAGKMRAGEVERAVNEVAALVEIEPILDRYPSSISGGQQQRASLARALVRPADLYLLDEPMGQLEPRLRALLRGRLKQLLTERGMTSIFVTHDQTEANALADRVAVMEGGVLQQLANQTELKERPANLFVATFIGEPPMNVFDAKAEVGERVRFLVEDGPKLDFSANEFSEAARREIAKRPRVVIGARPHDVRLNSGNNEARAVSNQWLGDQSHLALYVAGKLMVAVAFSELGATRGDSLRYDIPSAKLHVFDAESGKAVSHGSKAA